MATLREQIAQQEADHKEEIYRLERKQVVDKDRCVAHSDVNILTKRVANVPILYYSCITIIFKSTQFCIYLRTALHVLTRLLEISARTILLH